MQTAIETITLTLTGTTPLVMHHPRLADPLDPATKALKEITGKARKTEADHLRMAELEWHASLYHDADLGPYVPAEWVWRTISKGGTQFRKGSALQRGLLIQPADRLIALEYAGPRDPASLFATPEHVLRSAVNANPSSSTVSKTMRTRPVFEQWACTAHLLWIPTAVDLDDITRAAEFAGWAIGIGDGRGIGYGRFQVEVTR